MTEWHFNKIEIKSVFQIFLKLQIIFQIFFTYLLYKEKIH